MENNENLVEETEKVEETTEEIKEVEEPKQERTFTEKELDEIVAKKLARKEEKVRREYDKKYGRIENVLNAGLGTESIEEATDKLSEFYTQKGVNIPQDYISNRDLERLARDDADEIISEGYDEIVSEVDRLAALGDKMTQRDKLVFTKLANERTRLEESKELAKMGVQELDDDFKAFEAKLNPNLSMKEKYEMYLAQKPKKENNIIGSMTGSPENKIKDYYSPEEIAKLTDEDLDDPQIWEAVRKSMTRQN